MICISWVSKLTGKSGNGVQHPISNMEYLTYQVNQLNLEWPELHHYIKRTDVPIDHLNSDKFNDVNSGNP